MLRRAAAKLGSSVVDATLAAMLGAFVDAATPAALQDASVHFPTPAATPDASFPATPEVDAATFWGIDHGLAPVVLGPVTAEVIVGTLFEPDFAFTEFESGGLCGLAGIVVGAAAVLGAALQVLCRAAFLKFFAALSALGRAALLNCCALLVKL